MRLVPDDLVRIQLKRPFRDGTEAVDLDPLSLLSRLAAAYRKLLRVHDAVDAHPAVRAWYAKAKQ